MLANIARGIASPFGQTINSILFKRAVLQWGEQRGFNVIQAHDAPALRAACALATNSGAHLVYDAVEFVDSRSTYRTTWPWRVARRLESRIEAGMIRRAASCFAIGPSMSQWMASRYQIRPPTVIRNCRDFIATPGPSQLRRDCGIDNQKLVLFMNSLAEGRGTDEFLSALRKLDSDVHAVFLGVDRASSQVRQITAHAEALKLQDRVHFLEPVPPFELIDYISDADVGVIPFKNTHLNHFYSLPNRLFELIMARVPVAASAFPDMQDLIENSGIGRCFDPEDSDDQAQAISRLLHSLSDTTLSDAMESAARTFSWESESAAYTAKLDELVAR